MPKRKSKAPRDPRTGTWAVVRDDGIILGTNLSEKRAQRLHASMPDDLREKYRVKDLRGRRTIRVETQ